MTILSAQTIRARLGPHCINPFVDPPQQAHGLSFGLGAAGYDIRIGKIDRRTQSDSYLVKPGECVLLSALEWLSIPNDMLATVTDKSTLARKFLALQNTVIEPGWQGYLTLELSNHSTQSHRIHIGQPIAQILFHLLDQPTDRPYKGKYQDQENRPVHAITDWNPE